MARTPSSRSAKKVGKANVEPASQPTRSVQKRSIATRQSIVDGAIKVIATEGVHGLTHRSVAKAGGTSLAATTRHFQTKSDILTAASVELFDHYLRNFERLYDRMRSGQKPDIRTLDDLTSLIVLNSLDEDREQDRMLSLAWFEVVIHSGRTASGRALAQEWFVRFYDIWERIVDLLGTRSGEDAAGLALDRAIGLALLLHPLGFSRTKLAKLLEGRVALEKLIVTHHPMPAALDSADAKDGAKAAVTKDRIVQAAIGLLVEEGAYSVTFRAVAERCGMVRSAPAYHFPTVAELLETAQAALFERAKGRYKSGLGSHARTNLTAGRLADLSTTILFREVMEYPKENLGFYSAWLNGTQNRALVPIIASLLQDQYLAWRRRLRAIRKTELDARAPLFMQATFLGALIRTIGTDAQLDQLADLRESFARAIRRASSM